MQESSELARLAAESVNRQIELLKREELSEDELDEYLLLRERIETLIRSMTSDVNLSNLTTISFPLL